MLLSTYLLLALTAAPPWSPETAQILAPVSVPDPAPHPLQPYSLTLDGGAAGSLVHDIVPGWETDLLFSYRTPLIIWDIQGEALGMGGSIPGTPFNARLAGGGLASGVRIPASIGPLTASAGTRVGALALYERYSGSGMPPGRLQIAPHIDGVLRLEVEIDSTFFVAVEGAARVIGLRQLQSSGAYASRVEVQPVLNMGVGVAF